MVLLLSYLPKNTFVQRAFPFFYLSYGQKYNVNIDTNLSKKSVDNIKMNNINFKIYSSISNELIKKYYTGNMSIYSIIDTQIELSSGISNYKIIEYNKIKSTDFGITNNYSLNIHNISKDKQYPILKLIIKDKKEGYKIDLNEFYKGDIKIIYDNICKLTKIKNYCNNDL